MLNSNILAGQMQYRIFVGVQGLGKYGELLCDGLRALGHEVDLCDDRPCRDLTLQAPKYNIQYLRKCFIGAIKKKDEYYYAEAIPELIRFINQYDFFYFFFAETLLPAMLDLPIISKLGKKVIFTSAGDDTIVPYIERMRREWRGFDYLDCMMSTMHAEPKSPAEILEKWYSNFNTLTRKLYMVRMVEHFGTFQAGTGSSGLAKKPFYRGLPICDPELVLRGFPKYQSDVIYPLRISHYSSNRLTKSSLAIQQLMASPRLASLTKDGLIKFFLHPILKQEIFFQSVLSDDIVIDQLAAHGSVTRQVAALCTLPVTGPNSEFFIDAPVNNVLSVEIFANDQLVKIIEYFALNLDAFQNRRDYSYYTAGLLTPMAQAQRLIEMFEGRERRHAMNSWGNHFLDDTLIRLNLMSPLVQAINDYSLPEVLSQL